MKLFNAQRFQLLKGKRFQKYIAYALGEIILVVIGILIALAVNDWNNHKADEKELHRIINVIHSDLEADLKLATALIERSEQPQILIEKILYDSTFKDSIRTCLDCRYLMTAGDISEFKSKGYELLVNFNKEVKQSNIFVDSLVNFYGVYNKDHMTFQNKIIIEEIVSNMQYLRDNFSWFAAYFKDTECNTECLDYFESSDYINRLTYYEALFFDNYLYYINQYRDDLKHMIAFLNQKQT
ncbi:DUF6090 family protein [Psychroserpens mesophilus]|uniref:DUF6090 family protein n=1 Tax=Psychroserpens mesophilus TaxID=325473 RepID=UPI003F497D2E